MTQYYTTTEVAEREGLNRFAVLHMCRRGTITPAKMVAGRWLIQAGYHFTYRPRGRPKAQIDSCQKS
ncbi:hypothetical protein [Comamonas sp.]|uniref:hypothetical protein n=1 Tax=Comamonas sp. TaxID=34028 RepID=UPI0028AC3BB0|nr:hypothetical protein [Comamonas sp.]